MRTGLTCRVGLEGTAVALAFWAAAALLLPGCEPGSLDSSRTPPPARTPFTGHFAFDPCADAGRGTCRIAAQSNQDSDSEVGILIAQESGTPACDWESMSFQGTTDGPLEATGPLHRFPPGVLESSPETLLCDRALVVLNGDPADCPPTMTLSMARCPEATIACGDTVPVEWVLTRTDPCH